jgi:hypothetical protein
MERKQVRLIFSGMKRQSAVKARIATRQLDCAMSSWLDECAHELFLSSMWHTMVPMRDSIVDQPDSMHCL